MAKGGRKLKNTTEKAAKLKPKKINLKVRQVKGNKSAKRQISAADKKITSKKKQREIIAQVIKQAEGNDKVKKKKFFLKKKRRSAAVNLLGNNQEPRNKKRAVGAKSGGTKTKNQARVGIENKKRKAEPLRKNEKLINNYEVDYEKLEKDKRLIMISGVTFFMVLISFFWIYNFKHNLEERSRQSAQKLSNSDWEDFTDNISKNLEEMKSGLEQIKNFASSTSDLSTSSRAVHLPENKETEQASSTPKAEEEKINMLKEKLEEIGK